MQIGHRLSNSSAVIHNLGLLNNFTRKVQIIVTALTLLFEIVTSGR